MREQGFTLLEVLIAAAIIAVLAIGITSAAVLLTRVSADSEQQTVALELANRQVEYLRSQPFGDIGTETPATQDLQVNSRTFTLTTRVFPAEPLKHTRVTVRWRKSNGGEREISVHALLSPAVFAPVLPGPLPTPPPGNGVRGTLFKFRDTKGDTFIFELQQEDKINKAREILRDPAQQQSTFVSGNIIKQPAPYNQPWSYHLDPHSIHFPEVAIEVCDATIKFVEEHLNIWGEQWCPWSARLIEEVQVPPG